MRPVLFSLGRLHLSSYKAFLSLGIAIGLEFGFQAALWEGLPGRAFLICAGILLVPALVGARLWFVVAHLSRYRHDPRRIWDRTGGGMALYGGLLAALASSAFLLPALAIGFTRFWDAASLTMLAGMAVTRIGCLLNGCCAGRPTAGRLGWVLPGRTGWVRRFPSQVVEGVLAAALFGAETALLASGPPAGTVFLSVLCLYGAIRWLSEPLREQRYSEVGLFAPRFSSAVLFSVGAVGTFTTAAFWGG
jgi:phosphatidylglycerol---prolipoprotein diacylglyceryl transferase